VGADFRVYCNLPWHHAPEELKVDGIPLLVYTMYESTRVPAGWIKFLNDHADVVIVPSEFCYDSFLASGLKKPLVLVHLGYDPSAIKPCIKESDKHSPYIYLWQGVAMDRGGRKGFDIAIKAFKELRKEKRLSPSDRLIVKVRKHPDTITMEGVEDGDGVLYHQRTLTRDEMNTIYKSVDCCINPTRGEGFGLIPLEQMAMGKPVIITGWSMPYVRDDICITLPYVLKKSKVFWNHKHITIGLNGITYNFGGLYGEIKFLPKYRYPGLSRRETAIMPPGEAIQAVNPFKKLKNSVVKTIFRHGFFLKPGRKNIRFQFEFTGFDAEPDLQVLKNKMMWCYNNRTEAEHIGFRAMNYVSKCWTLDLIKSDFQSIIPKLRSLKHGNS
jgi:hypothetical protein